MINCSLRVFAAKIQQAGYIGTDDAQWLQRDILPDGISSREEAELLLTLDRIVAGPIAPLPFGSWP